ncbi:MAG: hypothetical protein PHY99_02005 [Bacteroidales bacterium]|nr:hypothetical protein [Bacteroidales bacterium]
MKYLLVILALYTGIANAQEIKPKRARRIPIENASAYSICGISQDGLRLQATKPGSKNLFLIDIKSGKAMAAKDSSIEKSGIITIQDTILALDKLTPVLSINGIKKVFRPGGDGNYIWTSLSPDKTKILYYLVGKGTFVCDLNGETLASPGKINSPKWLNNKIIIGMVDQDDGHRVTASDLVYFSLNTGRIASLTTTKGRHEMYPIPFADGKKIIFSTDEGKVYIMKLRIRK